MSLTWEQTIIAAHDPEALGQWWCSALDWVVVDQGQGEFEIRQSADRMPGLLFVSVDKLEGTRGRLHLDFRPDDQAAEVERLERLGAVGAETGHDAQSWVVLLDPEGNEFCVLRSHE